MMMMITMSFAMSGYKNFVQDQLSILECFLLFGFEDSEPKKELLQQVYGYHQRENSCSRCTAITKGKTPVPVCSPKLSPVGRG